MNAIAAGMVAGGGLLLVLGLLVAVPVLIWVLVPWPWAARPRGRGLDRGLSAAQPNLSRRQGALRREVAGQDAGKSKRENEGMGASSDEIERQIKETREHIDENLGVLEHRAASNAQSCYGKIAAVVVVRSVAVAGAVGVLIYRRMNRPDTERLNSCDPC